MKKNIKNIFAFIFGLFLVMQSCTNLDEEVYDKIQASEFGSKEAEVRAILGPVYNTFKSIFPGDYFTMVECVSDMAVTPTRKGGDWWDGGQFKEFRLHRWTPNTSAIRGSYNSCMGNITLCNKVYYTIEQNKTITDKEQTLAEIRGVRAFWYYILIDNWGNVPIVTDFTDTSMPKTSSRKQVYEFILSELNAIKDVVREDVTSASYGKMTKGAVYTLLAKMYLNALVWNPEGGAKWQECIEACNKVISLGYLLEPVWATNFQVNNQISKEIILPAIFTKSIDGNHLAKRTLHYLDPQVLGLSIGTWNGISAMPDYVKSFDPEDKRKSWSFLTGEMKDPKTGTVIVTAHGRPLIHTEDINISYNIDAEGWGQVEQEEGARCFKWEYEKGLSTDMENDFAIFRLADVYLMKAEALVRSGQDNGEATRLVNEIRKRGFDDPLKLKSSVSLEEIYMERRFELAWECYTRQDQIRFETFLDPIPGWKGQSDPKYLLFPIPQTARDANPDLQQNPGY